MKLAPAAVLRYGLFGLPLALVALPLYLQVPKYYNDRFGLSLAVMGSLLLALRLLDALSDPWLGWWIDRQRQARAGRFLSGYRFALLLALPLLAAGFAGLFLPPVLADTMQVTLWLAAMLVLVYAGFSLATIAHQAWGAELATEPGERGRVTAVREACALCGVLLAAIVPQVFGMTVLTGVFVVTLSGAAALLILQAPHPPTLPSLRPPDAPLAALRLPLTVAPFRRLLLIFLLNGIASAIPATLVLFFIRDVLQLEAFTGLFLTAYFAAGVVSMPLWLRLARRFGLARAWLFGMLAAIVAFAWTAGLEAGAFLPYLLVCIVSGAVLGADLALPAALLAGVIQGAGHQGQGEGAYFGLWTFATKLNLALAAGLALPLLDALGYQPVAGGGAAGAGLLMLSLTYAVLPCLLKALAALVLWRSPFFKERS